MKNMLRKYSIEKRKKISSDKYDEKIIKNLLSLEEYKKAKNIICYYPLKYEVNTLICFTDKTKNWFLPRVNGENLDICPYCDAMMKTGSFYIMEPVTQEIKSYEYIDLIIIPSAAADKNGYRLGYGKGFYDRFLSKNEINAVKIILTYSDLLFPTVYPEAFDVKGNIIITDKEILRI